VTEELHKEEEQCDGSRPLRNRRREAFSRLLFEGVEVLAAYEQAGFKRPRGNAQRMEREAEVQARINYLRRELDAADLALRTVRRRQLRDQLMGIVRLDRVEMFEEIEIIKKTGRGRNAREIKLYYVGSNSSRSPRSLLGRERLSKVLSRTGDQRCRRN
jgi:hypothetical protein